jgi:hypothetical protein
MRDVNGDCACGLLTDRFERLLLLGTRVLVPLCGPTTPAPPAADTMAVEGGDMGARDAAFIEPVNGRDIPSESTRVCVTFVFTAPLQFQTSHHISDNICNRQG